MLQLAIYVYVRCIKTWHVRSCSVHVPKYTITPKEGNLLTIDKQIKLIYFYGARCVLEALGLDLERLFSSPFEPLCICVCLYMTSLSLSQLYESCPF